jgi:hypothetical protein
VRRLYPEKRNLLRLSFLSAGLSTPPRNGAVARGSREACCRSSVARSAKASIFRTNAGSVREVSPVGKATRAEDQFVICAVFMACSTMDTSAVFMSAGVVAV